jgi:hypothetical protein
MKVQLVIVYLMDGGNVLFYFHYSGLHNIVILLLDGVKYTLGLCKIIIIYSLDCAHAFIFILLRWLHEVLFSFCMEYF